MKTCTESSFSVTVLLPSQTHWGTSTVSLVEVQLTSLGSLVWSQMDPAAEGSEITLRTLNLSWPLQRENPAQPLTPAPQTVCAQFCLPPLGRLVLFINTGRVRPITPVSHFMTNILLICFFTFVYTMGSCFLTQHAGWHTSTLNHILQFLFICCWPLSFKFPQ